MTRTPVHAGDLPRLHHGLGWLEALESWVRSGAQELRQEGREEERGLGIKEGDDRAVAERASEGWCPGTDGRDFGLPGVQGVDAEIDEIQRPRYLTTVNATDETANNAASPRAAATMLPRLPKAIPAADASPTCLPCVLLRVTI